jgi:HPt (histidine-containing phosphotransfer) domain-containing protein/HAMP domain-containing protein
VANSSGKLKSLRGKFVRILLVVSVLMSVVTTSIVVLMSAQASSEHFTAVRGYIEEGIISKGKVLTQQHALALRGMVMDNAFLDMQRLIDRAIQDDQDLAYGVFVNSDFSTLAQSERGKTVEMNTAPDRDAWRSLGLRENELRVQSSSVRHVTRLGRDLLEVAVPVTSEEGEALGTVIYGLSTERMHDALARAEHESRTHLWRSVLLMITLVGIVTGLGLMLSRAEAVHITEPIDALRGAAEALASGDRSVRVDITSGDELALLGSSFNHMVDELDSSYRELERLNRTLEQKVEARTAELALKNRDMRLVLDNVDQGFINLSPQGVIVGESSAIVARWFGVSDGGQPFWEYIERTSGPFAIAFRGGWSLVEDGFLLIDMCLSQLPAQLTQGQRAWAFRYLPLQSDRSQNELEGVLVAIAEVTDRLAREREEAEHAELMQAAKKLMRDRSGFTSFLQEATGMVEEIATLSAAGEIAALKRTLHTLKGNLGVAGLTVVAQLCHALEDQLAEEGKLPESALNELRERWMAITHHVTDFLGVSQRVVEVPEADYEALVSRLTMTDPQSEVLRQLVSWQHEPASKPLSRLADQAKLLARRLGRGEINVDVSAEDVRLDPRYWAPFFSELVHVVRNAIDHGLEPPSERLALGKPARGSVAFRVHVEGHQLTFEVSDDGRGIDWEKVEDLAIEKGLPHATESDLLDAICADGLTTRRLASDISGRGVGMASFRRRLDALRGRLDVRSVKGAGTTWLMHFRWPVREQTEPAELDRAGVTA